MFVAIAVWAVVENDVTGWVTLGVVTALLAISTLIKYLWPMKHMREADVRTLSLVAGAVLGIIGFFVIPVVGLVIGFVLGIYLAELANRRDQRVAWTSTKHALKGVALSVGVELSGALLATVAWSGCISPNRRNSEEVPAMAAHDLAELWDAHCRFEFETRDVDATMATRPTSNWCLSAAP